MRTGLAIHATLSSIKSLLLNRIDCIRNEYTELLAQFPELTRPTTKDETVKHGITYKIVTNSNPVFACLRSRPGFNSGIDLELDLIPILIPGIGMGINF